MAHVRHRTPERIVLPPLVSPTTDDLSLATSTTPTATRKAHHTVTDTLSTSTIISSASSIHSRTRTNDAQKSHTLAANDAGSASIQSLLLSLTTSAFTVSIPNTSLLTSSLDTTTPSTRSSTSGSWPQPSTDIGLTLPMQTPDPSSTPTSEPTFDGSLKLPIVFISIGVAVALFAILLAIRQCARSFRTQSQVDSSDGPAESPLFGQSHGAYPEKDEYSRGMTDVGTWRDLGGKDAALGRMPTTSVNVMGSAPLPSVGSNRHVAGAKRWSFSQRGIGLDGDVDGWNLTGNRGRGIDQFETAGFAGVGIARASPSQSAGPAEPHVERHLIPTSVTPRSPPNNNLARQPSLRGDVPQVREPLSPESIYEAEINTASRSRAVTPSFIPSAYISTMTIQTSQQRLSTPLDSIGVNVKNQPQRDSKEVPLVSSITEEHFPFDLTTRRSVGISREDAARAKRPLQGILKQASSTGPNDKFKPTRPPRPIKPSKSSENSMLLSTSKSATPQAGISAMRAPLSTRAPSSSVSAPLLNKSHYIPLSGPYRPTRPPHAQTQQPPKIQSSLSTSSMADANGSDTAGITGFPLPPTTTNSTITSLPYARSSPNGFSHSGTLPHGKGFGCLVGSESPSVGFKSVGDLMLSDAYSETDMESDDGGRSPSPRLGGGKKGFFSVDSKTGMSDIDAVERDLHDTVEWARKAVMMNTRPVPAIPSITITTSSSSGSIRALNRRLSRAKDNVPLAMPGVPPSPAPVPRQSTTSEQPIWEPLSQTARARAEPNYRSATYSIYGMYEDVDEDEDQAHSKEAMARYPLASFQPIDAKGASRGAVDPSMASRVWVDGYDAGNARRGAGAGPDDIGSSFAKEMGASLGRIGAI